MNTQTLVAEVWSFAHVLRDQGMPNRRDQPDMPADRAVFER